MSLGQRQVAVAEGFGPSVDGAEVGAADTSHEPCPDLGIDHAVQIQALLGIVAKRGGDAHLIQLQTGHIVQVVQAVVIIGEHIVRMPHVIDGPVVHRGGAPDILELPADPAGVVVAVFAVQYPAVTLHGLLGAYAEQADRLPVPVCDAVPSPELLCQFLLVHPVVVGRHRVVLHVDDVRMVRHGADPQLLLGVIPGIPEHFIVAERRSGRHRKADPVGLHVVLDPGKGALDVLCRERVLCLKILVEYADLLLRIIFFLEIQDQVQQQTAVLAAGEGDKDVVKFFEDIVESVLQCIVYILTGIFSFRCNHHLVLVNKLLSFVVQPSALRVHSCPEG